MDEKFAKAQQIFKDFKAYLDNQNWHYNEQEDGSDFYVELGIRGEDLPIKLRFIISGKSEMLSLYSPLPFDFDEATRTTGAIATGMLNHKLVEGSFDYDFSDGSCLFRLTNSWKYTQEFDVAKLFDYFIDLTMYTVDRYNDKLFMVSKGMVEIGDLESYLFS